MAAEGDRGTVPSKVNCLTYEFAIADARSGTASCHLHRAIANAVESIVNSKQITDRSMKTLVLNIIAIGKLDLVLWHDMKMRFALWKINGSI
jgi:hypothetical protein